MGEKEAAMCEECGLVPAHVRGYCKACYQWLMKHGKIKRQRVYLRRKRDKSTN